MPTGLQRFQKEGDDHFITFSCYHRLPYLNTPTSRDLFLHFDGWDGWPTSASRKGSAKKVRVPHVSILRRGVVG